jgi:hypothetical protein
MWLSRRAKSRRAARHLDVPTLGSKDGHSPVHSVNTLRQCLKARSSIRWPPPVQRHPNCRQTTNSTPSLTASKRTETFPAPATTKHGRTSPARDPELREMDWASMKRSSSPKSAYQYRNSTTTGCYQIQESRGYRGYPRNVCASRARVMRCAARPRGESDLLMM